MTMELVLDLGQSGTRVKIGEQLVTFPIAKTVNEPVLNVVERILKSIPETKSEKVFLSLTGLLGDVGEVRVFGELCSRYLGAREVFVMDDGLAAYFGALGESDGVVLTIGSGVVAVSGNAGHFGHADGKGRIFGDLGGGFWIGQYAMRRAVATIDRRDTAEDLVTILRDEIEIYSALSDRTGTEAATLCIASAAKIAQGAEGGSESALQILNEGALHLSKTVNSAWSKVSDAGKREPDIALLGGLSKSPIYVKLIQREIENLVKCRFVPARSGHLEGAPLAARLFPEGLPPLLKVWRD